MYNFSVGFTKGTRPGGHWKKTFAVVTIDNMENDNLIDLCAWFG